MPAKLVRALPEVLSRIRCGPGFVGCGQLVCEPGITAGAGSGCGGTRRVGSTGNKRSTPTRNSSTKHTAIFANITDTARNQRVNSCANYRVFVIPGDIYPALTVDFTAAPGYRFNSDPR